MTRVEHVESAPIPSADPVDAIVNLSTELRATTIAADARRVSERLDSARFFVSVTGPADFVRPIVERIVGNVGVALEGRHTTAFRFGRFPHAQVTFRDGSRRLVPISSAERLSRAGISAIEVLVDSPLLRSGVCVMAGPPGTRRLYRRIDLQATSRTNTNETGRCYPGQRTVVVDATRVDEVDNVISLLTELAVESGAARVEALAAQHHRHLCIRLGHHLSELHRALVRSESAMLARINALTIGRVLAESVLEERSRRRDPTREALARSLEVERTKFLMATKADAVMALDDRLAQTNQPRHLIRAAAANASHEIAIDLLAGFWRRTSAEAEKPIAALSRSLLADLDVSLGDVGEHLSPQALTGFDLAPIRGLRRDIEWPAPSGLVAQIVDRVGLASRRRIESAARADLLAELTTGSRRIIERVLFDYDEASSTVERRFCELLDSALQSVHVAAELANEAQAGGADAVARARQRIRQWAIDLDAIVSRL